MYGDRDRWTRRFGGSVSVVGSTAPVDVNKFETHLKKLGKLSMAVLGSCCGVLLALRPLDGKTILVALRGCAH